MKHMIESEVFANKKAIEELKKQLSSVLEPPIKELSELPAASDYLDTLLTEHNKNLGRKIKLLILLFLFAPEYVIYDGYVNRQKGVATAIAKQLGISLPVLSIHRNEVARRYKCYGKFTSLVDEIYEKVAEHYNLLKK